ncbi:MAG: DegV family protein [Velocimicrobium sp.]
MSYKIIGDSCTDLTIEQRKEGSFEIVPLTLQIGNEFFVDDETFNQKEFIVKMSASSSSPKSACPAPESYMKLFDQADDIYIVTLSAVLSGSNNSAELAKKIYIEQNGNKNIAVFDSKSASGGQTLIAMKIQELADKGFSFEQVVIQVEKFRDEMFTYFVLESLENLRKNGRLSNMKAFIASALNIKPIMIGNDEGNIDKVDQARGMKKALIRMADIIANKVRNSQERTVAIAHCNNYERALFVQEELKKRVDFKDYIIMDTQGVSTLYANNGGIIVCL